MADAGMLWCIYCCSFYPLSAERCATCNGCDFRYVSQDQIPQEPRFDEYGNHVNDDGTLWNLDGKLAARNGGE